MTKYGKRISFIFILSVFASACGAEDQNELLELGEGKAEHVLLPRDDGQFDLVGNDPVQALRCMIGSSTCGVVDLVNSSKFPQNLYVLERTITLQDQWVGLFVLIPGAQLTIHTVPEYTWFSIVDSNGTEARVQIRYPHKDAPYINFNIVDSPKENATPAQGS